MSGGKAYVADYGRNAVSLLPKYRSLLPDVPACAEERSAYVVSAWCACCKRLVRRLYDVRTGTLR